MSSTDSTNDPHTKENKQEEQPLEGQIGYKGPAFLRKLAVIVGGNDVE